MWQPALGVLFVLGASAVAAADPKDSAPNDAQDALRDAQEALTELDQAGFSSREALMNALAPATDARGRGAVLWPLRVSLSGQSASPDPMEIMQVLGKTESLRRIASAIAALGSMG